MEKSSTFKITPPQISNSNCEINLLGGGIMNLYLAGKHILYAGTRPDGGQAFTHPCIPNFNIAKDLPNHGPARKELWDKVNENTISWEMTAIENIYPAGIKATRQFEIDEKSFTTITTIENRGSINLATNIAEHNYFNCPKEEVKNVKINGQTIHKEALKASAQYNHWQDKNILEIPGLGKLQFNTSGYQAFAQWTQPNAPFVCIEPIEIIPPNPEDFKKNSPKINPGEKKLFSYTITLN